MANKVLLKKSSVAAKVPLPSDLSYGELAVNYADAKLYFKDTVNAIQYFVSTGSTDTLTNKTLTSPTINGGALSGTFTGAITLSDTTASTSTTTGALKIGGGLGVAGTIYADQIRLTNNGAGTNVYIGDDVVLGDINVANTLGIRGQQDATKGYIVFGSSNNTAYIGRDGTNPITATGQFKIDSGTVTGGSAIALQITGYANKGGTGYHDFLSVTNAYPTATNPSKFFRLNSTGNLEIINSAYTTNIFTITDAGAVTFGGTTFPTTNGTNGYVLTSNGTGGSSWTAVSGGGGGSGTVTSVSVASANGFAGTVANNTTTPAITISTSITGVLYGNGTAISAASSANILSTFGSQTANTFIAAPNGSAGTPTFRSIVAADVPTLNQNTTGYAAGIAGGVNGSIPYQSAANTTGFITPATTSGQFLQSATSPSAPFWVSLGPVVLNDISPQFDGYKTVFDLALDQTSINSIVDSKDLEVVVNGQRLAPYVDTYTWPWLTPYDSYRGYRVVSTTTSSTLIVYNAPYFGDSAVLTLRQLSTTRQKKRYPFTATTVAFGD